VANLAARGVRILACVLTVSQGPAKRVYPAQLYPPRSHTQCIADARHMVEQEEMRNGVKELILYC